MPSPRRNDSSQSAMFEKSVRALVENGFDSVKLDGCGKQTNMSLYAELQRQSGKTFETENCK